MAKQDDHFNCKVGLFPWRILLCSNIFLDSSCSRVLIAHLMCMFLNRYNCVYFLHLWKPLCSLLVCVDCFLIVHKLMLETDNIDHVTYKYSIVHTNTHTHKVSVSVCKVLRMCTRSRVYIHSYSRNTVLTH